VASLEDALTHGGFDSSAFAAALAETTQSLVCVLDAEGRILVFNEACERATGFSRDEVLGRDARDFVIPPEEREAFDAWIAEVWRTRLPSPQVGHWVTRDGGRILVAWSNGPVLGEDGDLQYLMTTGLDITESQRTEAEKRALEGDLEAKLVQISHLAQEQRGLRRVATLVAAEAPPERVFMAVSEECAGVLDGTACAIFRFEPEAGIGVVVGRYSRRPVHAFLIGDTVTLDENSAVGRVYLSGETVRIDKYDDIPGPVAEMMKSQRYRYTVASPIVVGGSCWGAVAVASSEEAEDLPAQSEARLRDFCELIAFAVASAQAREDVRASRARIVQAADAELRELARGLHPVALTELGLRPALQGLAERAPVRVEISGVPDERLPAPVEAAAYYIVAETLTNSVKHAEAEACRVVVAREDEHVTVEVSDDGRGGADPARGSGLVGLRDRVDAPGGSLTVDSPPGDGTVVRAVLPLGLAD